MSDQKPVRVGMLGSGSISDYHIKGLQAAGAQVIALFTRSEAKARQQADKHGIPNVTTRYQEVLAREDVDAVIIATPDSTHEEIAVATARAGKAMLVQKPMARTAQECRNIIKAALQANVRLYTSYMHRYFGEIERTQQLLAEQTLGQITLVRQRNATPGANWAAWFYRKDQVGGGAVMQIGIHGLDLLRYLFGEILAVKATIATTLKERKLIDGSIIEPDNEDLALATYRFASGVMATHEISYTEIAGTDRFRMEIYGTRGTAWLRTEKGALAINAGQGWSALDVPTGDVGWRHHRHWVAMLRGEEPTDNSAQDSLATALVTEAIYRSAEKDAWEKVA